MPSGSLTSRSENKKKNDRINLKSSAPVEDVDLEWAMGPQGRARKKIPKAARLLNQRTDVRLVRVHHRVWVADFPGDQDFGRFFALLNKDLRVRREKVFVAHGTAACHRRDDGATVCARLRVWRLSTRAVFGWNVRACASTFRGSQANVDRNGSGLNGKK